MPSLSKSEIAALAKQAGFSGENVNIAAAVALAESGGNPRAHNAVPPDDSYGLWQINMLGSLGPDRRKRYNLSSNEALYDPATNARVAYGIFQGSGWKAWTTYTRGTYKKHMSGSVDTSEVTSTPPTGTATFDPVNGVSGAINAFGETLFKTGANIGGIAVALVLLVLGLLILGRGQVTKVLPAGKAAKIVKAVT